MFAENLLESAGPRRGRRGWTTAASLTVQAAVLSLFALVPLVYPDAMSILRPEPISIPMFSPAPVQPIQDIHRQAVAAPTTNATFIPSNNSGIRYGHPREEASGVGEPPTGLFPASTNNLAVIPGGRLNVTLVPERPAPGPVRLSRMEPGSLTHNVLPLYPPPARQAGIEGVVVLHAFISREGTIESLQVVSGHPFLARAALDAVRQWRYRPYVLNGQPVEVETQITVNFTLGRN